MQFSFLSQLPLVDTAGPTSPANQPGSFPDFPLPSQPKHVRTVLNRNDTCNYNKQAITLPESVALERETRQQDTCNLWHLARSPRRSLSSFKRICSRKANYDSLAASNKTTATGQTTAMKRGVHLEPVAAELYSEVTGNLLFPCGFVVDPDAPHLGTSPDRKVIIQTMDFWRSSAGQKTASKIVLISFNMQMVATS